jgi:hypothetical protein
MRGVAEAVLAVVLGAQAANAATVERNWAHGKSVHQSSSAFGGDAARAVDGNRDGAFVAGSVTHTADEIDHPFDSSTMGGPVAPESPPPSVRDAPGADEMRRRVEPRLFFDLSRRNDSSSATCKARSSRSVNQSVPHGPIEELESTLPRTR